MSFDTKIVNRDFGPVLSLDGVNVSLTRNDETGQMVVYIDTSDSVYPDDVHDTGVPVLQVDTNDGTVYDVEDDGRCFMPEYTMLDRLRADLEYHQAQAKDNSRGYTLACERSESYHEGRVAALTDVLSLLQGRPVSLYSETERKPA